MPETLQLLHYEYVSDMADKRAPHRDAHLSLIEEYHAEGKLVIAGAVGDPVHSGLLAFRSAKDAAAFAGRGPVRRRRPRGGEEDRALDRRSQLMLFSRLADLPLEIDSVLLRAAHRR